MVRSQLLLSGLALGPLAAGRPAGSQLDPEGDAVVIYDPNVPAPTRVPEVFTIVNRLGQRVGSVVENVMIVPSPGPNVVVPSAQQDVFYRVEGQRGVVPTAVAATARPFPVAPLAPGLFPGVQQAQHLPATPIAQTQVQPYRPQYIPGLQHGQAFEHGKGFGGSSSSSDDGHFFRPQFVPRPQGAPPKAIATPIRVPQIQTYVPKLAVPPVRPVPFTPRPSLYGSSAGLAKGPSRVNPFNGTLDAFDVPPPAGRSFGISYAPYSANHACKSRDEIRNDFGQFGPRYGTVRIYGTDCDQVRSVCDAAKSNGMRVMLGVWNPNDVVNEINRIVTGVGGDWGLVHTVSVGNELVNNHQATPSEIVRAVSEARAILRRAGYTGPVVTVDTFKAYLAHPELARGSDYCAINAHAFFDPTVAAPHAGDWLYRTVNDVQSVCGPKRVIVTESGWPHRGDPNGLAIPSLVNQRFAMDSIKRKFAATPDKVVLFSAFNDLWKSKAAATFNADQYWGIGGAISSSDR
ncbi:hypothetical protein HIM_04271 [Hirsutella minnesotensis 3608]|uniref:Uncharacterized protein n=1 Tax=Hirsutella minnesotensis 3608 TaxID=1043627 RepID=A0A0F8A5Z5_9HYPO|nr:hypothetical protein HIM_04271 [Hirsutella minnesotensis 3608]